MCFWPHIVCENALLWVTMVLKSSLWCLGDLREPQQQLPMLFATFFPYTTNPQSQNLQKYAKLCVLPHFVCEDAFLWGQNGLKIVFIVPR